MHFVIRIELPLLRPSLRTGVGAISRFLDRTIGCAVAGRFLEAPARHVLLHVLGAGAIVVFSDAVSARPRSSGLRSFMHCYQCKFHTNSYTLSKDAGIKV